MNIIIRNTQYSFWLPMLVSVSISMTAQASPVDGPLNLSNVPLFVTTASKPNILVVLDNSNSMDEDETGMAVGGANADSKSEIARSVISDELIPSYLGEINLGLMAYEQNPADSTNSNDNTHVILKNLHASYYDASYDPANYDETFTGASNSTTKRYRIPNPTSPGNYIHYNVTLPFYSNNVENNSFCYSPDGNAFDDGEVYVDGSDTAPDGPWDFYRCFSSKTGLSDTLPTPPGPTPPDHNGYKQWWMFPFIKSGINASETTTGYSGITDWASPWGVYGAYFFPTDSDIAQGIMNFGKQIASFYVSPTWISNSSPGRGYLHTPIEDLDATQATALQLKIDTSQFVTNAPTNSSLPLQNAGLTPIEGTLLTAKDYFTGVALPSSNGGPAAALPDSCSKDFVVLLTDGLPSTDKDGNIYANTTEAMEKTVEAATEVLAAGIESYVIGFSLPDGVDPTVLDTLANAGGTTSAYSATDSASLTSAFSTIFGDIISKLGSAASASTNSTNLRTDSHVYLAVFYSGDWDGHLLSKSLDENGVLGATEWDAGAVLTAKDPATRKIITYSRDTADGIPFTWSAIDGLSDSTQKDFLNKDAFGVSDSNGENRVSYLRGNTVSGMRARTNSLGETIETLGDIVNSTPFYTGAPQAGYSGSSYYAFSRTWMNREAVIYVGANDGMLHGFAADDGEELLAYVPSKLYGKLSQLTHVNYGTDTTPAVPHQYFVDGSPMVADAQLTISGTETWKTVLVGGLNSGGQGYYALDVTDPSTTSFQESNAADLVLWEFTDEDDADLGYSYTQSSLSGLTGQSSQIAKMANGEWALIIGNGYNNTEADGHASTTGKASLFVIFLDKGLDGSWTTTGDYQKIQTGSGTTSIPNGMSSPQPIDDDGDGDVDYVYAGDLYGSLWRFDVRDSTPSNWTKYRIARAKDASGNRQPITTAPVVTRGIVSGTYIVGFGTGKYIELNDISDSSVQSFYGIIDSDPSTAPSSVIKRATSSLTEQTVLAVVTDSGKEYRIVSDTDASTDGWYMDLPTTGERIAYNPIIRDGRFVFVTLIPDTDPCEAGGTSWLMEVSPFNGGSLGESPIDVNGDLSFNSSDKLIYKDDGTDSYVSGVMSTIGIIATPTIIDKTRSSEFKIETGSLGETETILESKTVQTGRMSWQEIR